MSVVVLISILPVQFYPIFSNLFETVVIGFVFFISQYCNGIFVLERVKNFESSCHLSAKDDGDSAPFYC